MLDAMPRDANMQKVAGDLQGAETPMDAVGYSASASLPSMIAFMSSQG